MKKPKNSNHRDKSNRKRAREMGDMKSENAHLRRQVARLQREVDRLEFVGNVDNEDDALEIPKKKQELCRVCGTATLKEITTPSNKVIIICTQCLCRQVL